jgi:hypothetical protein
LPALASAVNGEVLPGLYHDKATKSLDALYIQGRSLVYFAANRGREPLYIYIYLVAASK